MPALIWEREAVQGAIERTLQTTLAGHGSALFIVGEAGLGKTTMVERAQAMAKAG
jgi:transcriptional regulator with AAA-type ATPase domain